MLFPSISDARTTMDGVGGYDYQFVSTVDPDFFCPVCHLVLREPHQTKCCGHHMCESCARKIQRPRSQFPQQQARCPVCQQTGFTSEIDKYFKRKVSELRIKCPYEDRGCQWEGELAQLETKGLVKGHLDGCMYKDIVCTYGCGERVQRGQLARHQKEKCPQRWCCCTYCSVHGTYQEVVDIHYPVCPKYPLHCPNNCKKEVIETM